ncbi:MAG: DPBB and LysM peptidoglycan-binding domain-containing protein [Mucilaginibacter sp.]
MKFKILLLFVSLFAFSSSFATSVKDSIGVKNNDGKKMIVFKIKAGDTYYSIGHRYNIKPAVLMKFNGAKKETLSLGKIIYVPTDIPFKKSKKEKSESVAKESKKAKVPEHETKKEKKARLAREAKEERAAERRKHKEEAEEAPAPEPKQAEQAPVAVNVQLPQQPAQQPQQTVQQDNTPPTQYKVGAGETLYSIAKRFGTTVDQVTKFNKLTSTNLQPGQILLIPNTPSVNTQTVPQVQQAVQTVTQQQAAAGADTQRVVAKQDSNLKTATFLKDSAERHISNPNKFGIYEKDEKGAATWIDDPSLDPNKKLVLHRTAPIGTVIKITNPMTNRTTFAKVVGRFTDNESTKDVIIVMTKNVADALGALDKRFHVNISYGSPNE